MKESLVVMASLYAEYEYLNEVFVKNHQCLFGVKAELYSAVKSDLDAYEGAYILWTAGMKRAYNYSKEHMREFLLGKSNISDPSLIIHEMKLMSWGELLYGEERYSSDKERKDYNIRKYDLNRVKRIEQKKRLKQDK